MSDAANDPRPPAMSEVDWTNMVRRAAMELERERKSALYELVGRFLWNIERIADALERSARALSDEPKPLFASVDVEKFSDIVTDRAAVPDSEGEK